MLKTTAQTASTTQQTDTPPVSARRIFVVLNPVAGNSQPQVISEALDKYLETEPYEIYETTGQEDVPAIVTDAIERGFNFFVAAGGDGTVFGVANGLIDTDLPLAVLPMGTVNTLARELNIPLTLEDAVALLRDEYTTRCIDAIQVDSQICLLNVSIGVSALTIVEAEGQRNWKRMLGMPTYLALGLKNLIGFQPETFKLEVDGKSVRVRAKEIMITNARIIGIELFYWGPHVRPDDGRLDVCIVRSRSLMDHLVLVWNLLWGRQTRNSQLRYLEIDEYLKVETKKSLPVQGDGEFVGHPPVEIKVLPAAFRLVVPIHHTGD
jgi:YegS/Rv2252/BmrU family lipid kinase